MSINDLLYLPFLIKHLHPIAAAITDIDQAIVGLGAGNAAQQKHPLLRPALPNATAVKTRHLYSTLQSGYSPPAPPHPRQNCPRWHCRHQLRPVR